METLQNTFKKQLAFRKATMRRIWYSFLISLMVRPSLFIGFLFGASAIGFWKLVSITSIAQNLLQIRVGAVPQYIFASLTQTETMVVACFGVLCLVSVLVIVRSLKSLSDNRARFA